ncbi:MAG TPA: site-2 protease family protein, partial [Acidimicrobiales bacterium]|nr:site-2 protease family protein [Acidimicrobiales bacterium]
MRKRRWSWEIGRVAGIRIRIHASFLLLLLLPFVPGATDTPAGAAWELAWIGVVFACVLVHELAHSITATHFGIRVKDIVLIPIGGASEMERMPDNPRVEMAIAGAGPAASLLLAGVSLGVSAAFGQHWWPPGLVAGPLLGRLGWLNLILGGFNLLPVLPMDGGRLLRAALEPSLGRTRSVVVAARVGRVGGALMIALGLFYNLWMVFIGVFILLGASMESANAEAHEKLSVV